MVGTKTTKTVRVERRGTSFHDDDFFKDSWGEWDKAVRDVVHKWDSSPASASSFNMIPAGASSSTSTSTATTSSLPFPQQETIYRKIRSSNVSTDESQAASCTEEKDKYKMVLDVKDYFPEDINVKVVDDTVVVEGKIEKKEGNAISTQTFIRKFLLPPGINHALISSALSRDGVLTVNAPKIIPTPSIQEKPIPVERSPLSSNSSSNLNTPNASLTSSLPSKYAPITSSVFASSNNKPSSGRHHHVSPINGYTTITNVNSSPSAAAPASNHFRDALSDASSNHTYTMATQAEENHWNSFNEMVEKSQREMEDMLRMHSLHTPQHPPSPTTHVADPSAVVLVNPPVGASTSRDVVRDGHTVKEREDKRWEDSPAPGVSRSNRLRSEVAKIRDEEGNVVGNEDRKKHESKAEGSHEEILPDGTKRQIFTKTYETRNIYTSNSMADKTL